MSTTSYIALLRAQRETIRTQQKALLDPAIAAKRDLTPDEQRTFDKLADDAKGIDHGIRKHEQQAEEDAVVTAAFAKLGAGGNRATLRNDGLDDGRRSIDAAFTRGELPDHAADKALSLIDDSAAPKQSRSTASRWAAATGNQAYMGAFRKIMADPAQGHLLWTGEEADAFRAVKAVDSEMRAMSLTDAAGGFLVPLTLEPSIIITNAGTINPVRKVSRVVQTLTDQWQGVSSAGVTAEWIAEGTQVADASPTLDDVPIPVHKADAFVPYSFEVGDDAPGFANELQRLLIDAAERLSATAYTTGTGSGQPTGIIKALDGTASEVAPTVAETFTSADVYKVLQALPARWRGNATWQANLSILNEIDQFETTNGAKKFPQVGNDPSILLRRPLLENSDMDGTYDAAATADNFALLCGDFREYVIVDRIGTRLEAIPHLFGANGRPTLQRGALLWFRTGANVTTADAFRVLNIATTA